MSVDSRRWRSHASGPRVIRNWVNFCSGWAVVVGLTLAIVASDPFAVAWPAEGWTGVDRMAVTIVLGTGLGVLACHALFVKPRVLLDGDNVEIVNPVFRWRFRRSDIEAPEQTREGMYESLRVDGRRIRAVGTERSTLADMRGKEHYLSALTTPTRQPGNDSSPLVRRWSFPSPVEVAIILLYLGYLGLGWLSGAGIV